MTNKMKHTCVAAEFILLATNYLVLEDEIISFKIKINIGNIYQKDIPAVISILGMLYEIV